MLPKKSLMILCLLALGAIALTNLHAQELSTECNMVNNQEEMPVFFAPIYAPSQIKDVLPKDTPYKMIARTEGYYWIEYADGERGWIDYHTIISNGRCDASPFLSPILSDFPTMCFYIPSEDVAVSSSPEIVNDPNSSHYRAGSVLPVDARIGTVLGIAENGARYGGYVDGTRGTYSGHCEGTLPLASALENARVWTEPNAVTGQAITALELGIEVGIIEGPVQGLLRADSDLQGDWYKIKRGELEGWVWEERLLFGRTFTAIQASIGRATLLSEARVWSLPDVSTGKVVTTLMTGLNVGIIGEPVEGLIRIDPATQGTWYPVKMGGTTGWVLAERLDFGD